MFVFATEEMGREELKRPKNILIAIKLWFFVHICTEYGLVLIYYTSYWESILVMWDSLCVKQHSSKLWWRSGWRLRRSRELTCCNLLSARNKYCQFEVAMLWTFNNLLLLWKINTDNLWWPSHEFSKTLQQEMNGENLWWLCRELSITCCKK